jgi:hypothetical protein
MSVATYQQGVWIYFDRQCADPGQDGRGFGFTASDGNAAGTSSQPVVIHLACRASPKNLTSD